MVLKLYFGTMRNNFLNIMEVDMICKLQAWIRLQIVIFVWKPKAMRMIWESFVLQNQGYCYRRWS